MNEQEALWSAPEVRTQAAQAPGQIDVWEALEEIDAPCDVCGAYARERCADDCTWANRDR